MYYAENLLKWRNNFVISFTGPVIGFILSVVTHVGYFLRITQVEPISLQFCNLFDLKFSSYSVAFIPSLKKPQCALMFTVRLRRIVWSIYFPKGISSMWNMKYQVSSGLYPNKNNRYRTSTSLYNCVIDFVEINLIKTFSINFKPHFFMISTFFGSPFSWFCESVRIIEELLICLKNFIYTN